MKFLVIRINKDEHVNNSTYFKIDANYLRQALHQVFQRELEMSTQEADKTLDNSDDDCYEQIDDTFACMTFQEEDWLVYEI